MRAILLAALLLVSILAPGGGAAQPSLAFFPMGTDATGDDLEAVGSVDEPAGVVGGVVIPADGNDQADIDDVVGLAIAAAEDQLVFRVDVAQRPEDAENVLGRFCWVAAFQVDGKEEEFLALGCIDYDAQGTGTPFLGASSTRGTNVVSSVAWDPVLPAVLLTVDNGDVGVTPGRVLTDVYALTYMSGGLSVDDPAPDAKSDRESTESFGDYPVLLEKRYRWEYQDLDAESLVVTLSFEEDEWVQHVLNWTSTGPHLLVSAEASDPDLLWTVSVSRAGTYQFGFGSDGNTTGSQSSIDGEGALNITVSLRSATGTLRLTAQSTDDEVPGLPPPPGSPPATPPGSPGSPPSPVNDATPPPPGAVDEDGSGKGSPGFAWPAALAVVVGLALHRRRR